MDKFTAIATNCDAWEMTLYNPSGKKPAWHSKRGQKSRVEAQRRDSLVLKGLASRWLQLRDVSGAAEVAGL